MLEGFSYVRFPYYKRVLYDEIEFSYIFYKQKLDYKENDIKLPFLMHLPFTQGLEEH